MPPVSPRFAAVATAPDRPTRPRSTTALILAGSFVALLGCSAQPDRPFCEPGLPCPTASEASCAHGPEAERHGRTTFAEGTCTATDDAACGGSTLTCALWGQCHARRPAPSGPSAGGHGQPFGPSAGGHGQPFGPSAGGPCKASNDRDFAASRDPLCTTGTCLAIGDDCARARVCTLEGRCTARDGVCVGDAASCRESELCKTLGWCTLVGAQCRPGSVADCQASEGCVELGQCAYAKGQCSLCSRSAECRAEGLCHPLFARCAAFAPKHCAESAACQREGRCRLFQGACVR